MHTAEKLDPPRLVRAYRTRARLIPDMETLPEQPCEVIEFLIGRLRVIASRYEGQPWVADQIHHESIGSTLMHHEIGEGGDLLAWLNRAAEQMGSHS